MIASAPFTTTDSRFTAALFPLALCLVIRERMKLFHLRGGELKLYLFYLRCYHKKFIVTFYGFDIAYPDLFSRLVTDLVSVQVNVIKCKWQSRIRIARWIQNTNAPTATVESRLLRTITNDDIYNPQHGNVQLFLIKSFSENNFFTF